MRRLVIASVGAALALGSSAAGAPTWNEPVQPSRGDRALGPEIAVSPRGDAAVVWDQEVGTDCAASPASLGCAHVVELATRVHGSSTWQAPIELGRPGIGDRPRVAINDAGDAMVAWVHDIGRDRVLQATFRSRRSNVWPEPNDISEASLGIPDFRIGLDDRGNAIAVWSERTEAGTAVRIATRSADAGGWGAAKTLSRPGSDVPGGLSLAQDPVGAVALVWIEDGSIQERESVIGIGTETGNWTYPRQLPSPADGVAVGTPDVAFDQTIGHVVVVWTYREGASCCRVRAVFHSQPAEWVAQDLGAALPSFDEPKVAARKGTAVAVWVSGSGVAAAAHTQPEPWGTPAVPWSGATLVSTRGVAVARPAVATDSDGNAVAVWEESDRRLVRAAIRPGASGRWQPPLDVSRAGSEESPMRPRATDTNGSFLTVWNRSADQRVVVETSDLAGGGPVLADLQTPARAIDARTPARFLVRPVPWTAPLSGEPVWRFGDGRSAKGAQVRHRFTRPGRYRVTVTAADALGTTSESRWVRVRKPRA